MQIAESESGVKLVGAEQRRERGLCRGARAGNMWFEEALGSKGLQGKKQAGDLP